MANAGPLIEQKSPRKRKLSIYTRQRKVISVLQWHYHSIISEISEHDHYGGPLFPHHAPKVVHSACHWPLSGDVGTAFVVTLNKEIRTKQRQSLKARTGHT